ncbi:MAG: type 4a pilus biogenesis protein PilO [Lacunisphaera sp.]|nr:type 4a pilus biogenesis protein PilO [Lacunisphaera sp.]
MNARFQEFFDFTRRNPVIVASVAVLLVFGTASYFLWHRQHELTTSHEEVRRSGEDILQSLTGQTRITAEMATVTAALDFIDRNLINEADLAENLGYFYSIEAAARTRFTQLNQLSSQPQPDGSKFKPVPFSLRANGSYRQIMRLLHELETGPRLLRIRTYTLSQGEGGAEDTVTMELTVDVLARP